MTDWGQYYENSSLERRLAVQREYQQYDLRKWLFHLYKLEAGVDKMLDVGCGTAGDLIEWFFYYGKGKGIDASKKYTEMARKEVKRIKIRNIKIELGEAERMIEPQREYDLIVSNFAFYYFDTKLVLELMYRALKPSGVICIGGSPDENAREFNDMVYTLLGDDVPPVFAKGFSDVRKYEKLFRGYFKDIQFYRLINEIRFPSIMAYMEYVCSTPLCQALEAERRREFVSGCLRYMKIQKGLTVTKVVDVLRASK